MLVAKGQLASAIGICALAVMYKSLWRKPRTTNAIERSFVEVRYRTRGDFCKHGQCRSHHLRSSMPTTKNGANARSSFLHKLRDITAPDVKLDPSLFQLVECNANHSA